MLLHAFGSLHVSFIVTWQNINWYKFVFSYMLSCEYWWWEIDIHGCYSQVNIAFAPICTSKNNWWIWCHNASTSRSCDVTDQLWWPHNSKPAKHLPWRQWWNELSVIVFSRIVCSGHKMACKKWNNTFVTMNNDSFVSCEVICQWFSLVTLSLVKIIGKSPHSWP